MTQRPRTTAQRDDRHLTAAELAARQGVPVRTVYAWNYMGTGPAYLKHGRSVRYRLADVIAWEESHLTGNGR
jgi:predicted DNA-binding transcriptional regulator AlpA